MTEPATILAAVDGGGTGTRVRLHDAGGAVLASAEAGPSSLTLGVDQAWRNVGQALREAAAAAGIADPAFRICAALAGSRSPRNRAAFLAGNPLGAEITVVTDGYASLLGALDGRPGSVLAVGTGVAAHRLLPDSSVRGASGWGFPAGDEGGGAWIGHRAVQAFLKKQDGRFTADSPLLDALAGRLGADEVSIAAWLLEARATQYATLARAVVAAAEAGDPLAGGILDAAAGELAQALRALEPEGGTDPVALLGGLAATLAPRLPADVRARLVPARGSALDGVLRVLTGRSPAEALP